MEGNESSRAGQQISCCAIYIYPYAYNAGQARANLFVFQVFVLKPLYIN